MEMMQVYIFCCVFAEGGKRYALKVNEKIFSYQSIANLVRHLVRKEEKFFMKAKKEIAANACSNLVLTDKRMIFRKIPYGNLNKAEVDEFWRQYKGARKK
jgi:tryptophanase